MDPDELKRLAAARAVEQVHSGMVIGLGSGSTAAHFMDLLAGQINAGRLHDILGVPTSEKTAVQAHRLGIPLTTLSAHPHLDLAVDGADEVDPGMNLIKGLGRALLREKIVELHTKRFIVIVDERKCVPRLGAHVPLPVEIVRYEAQVTFDWLSRIGSRAVWDVEPGGKRIVTDNGNFLVHCWFEGGIMDLESLASRLAHRPGVVEHGLFIAMAHQVIVAGQSGIETLER